MLHFSDVMGQQIASLTPFPPPFPSVLAALVGGIAMLPSAAMPVLPPPEPELFYCDPCEKDFKVESQYKAHLATHVACHMPGCNFSASQRVVKEHISTAHGDGDG